METLILYLSYLIIKLFAQQVNRLFKKIDLVFKFILRFFGLLFIGDVKKLVLSQIKKFFNLFIWNNTILTHFYEFLFSWRNTDMFYILTERIITAVF